jgi:predicted transposase YbfD/YdcC
VLAQTKVSEKSNEIVAIPALLDLLSIEGAIVTIDAMGCQRAIAQKIIDKRADYVLALKGNQGTLQEDVALFVAEQKSRAFADTVVSVDQTVDGDHGRIETRRHSRCCSMPSQLLHPITPYCFAFQIFCTGTDLLGSPASAIRKDPHRFPDRAAWPTFVGSNRTG